MTFESALHRNPILAAQVCNGLRLDNLLLLRRDPWSHAVILECMTFLTIEMIQWLIEINTNEINVSNQWN